MTITYLGDGLYKGLSSDTKPTTTVATTAMFIETDTRKTFHYNGTVWLSDPLVAASCIVNKVGTTYYARTTDGVLLASSSTDVAVPLNAALTSLTSAGGNVFLSAGSYVSATPITLTQAFTGLVAETGAKIVPAAGSYDCITVNANDCRLDGFHLDCSNKTNGTGTGIKVGGTAQSLRTKIQNIFMKNAPTHGIYLDANSGGCFINNSTVQSFLSPTGHGILISGSSDHFIYDNDVGGYGNGNGIIVSGGGLNRIHNNEVYSNSLGIQLYLGHGNSVCDNNVQSNTLHGIIIKNDTGTTFRGVTVSNNRVRNNSTSSTNTYDGINFALSSTGGFDNVSVVGNVCTDDAAGGSKKQRYGISINSALLTNSVIGVNSVAGNATGGINRGTLGTGTTILELTQQAANANTSGATLAALETEVNELKALFRTVGLLAP